MTENKLIQYVIGEGISTHERIHIYSAMSDLADVAGVYVEEVAGNIQGRLIETIFGEGVTGQQQHDAIKFMKDVAEKFDVTVMTARQMQASKVSAGDLLASVRATVAHRVKVSEKITEFCARMLDRASVHDESKMHEPELGYFAEFGPKLSGMKYDDPKYKEYLRQMKPGVQKHYEANTHHPENNMHGLSGMSLLDIVEMFFDWKAASERMQDGGDFVKSLEISEERFKMDKQLACIFQRTAMEMGYIKLGLRCPSCGTDMSWSIGQLGSVCPQCLNEGTEHGFVKRSEDED
ncbi:hypothetical protein DRQ25_13770 [Candidatus Fermentibacteria bacterium]|nr:MAG: hypothetical protein DRQ25_13770 [Candidatus Fermentibacteria bacterium]